MSVKLSNTTNRGRTAVIDIEGTIGVPEEQQFEQPGGRIATYEKFRQHAQTLSEAMPRNVIVNIRSTGGSVNDALLIYEALSALGTRITTRCYGYVASAATIIAQAASPGCREVSANSLYLIHKALAAAEGNTAEMTKTIGLLEQTDQRIAAVYAARSGRPPEDFTQLMGENNGDGKWLSPEEVLNCGLADRITAGVPLPDNAAQAVANLGLPPVPDVAGLDVADMAGVSEVADMAGVSEVADVSGVPDVSAVSGVPGVPGVPDVAEVSRVSGEDGVTQGVTAGRDRAGGAKLWNAILEVIGLKSADSGSGRIETLAHEQAERTQIAEQTVECMAVAQRQIGQAHMALVGQMQNRIDQLESINARLMAGATETKPKDDPSPHEPRRSPNEEAYYADARRFL